MGFIRMILQSNPAYGTVSTIKTTTNPTYETVTTKIDTIPVYATTKF